MTIAEGTQFGPHRVLEKIGSGGMGEVYRAMDTRLEREVALKLVSESFLGVEYGRQPIPQGRHPALPRAPDPRAFPARGAFRGDAEPSQYLRHLRHR